MSAETKPRPKPEYMDSSIDNGDMARRMREIARAEGRPAPLQSEDARRESYRWSDAGA